MEVSERVRVKCHEPGIGDAPVRAVQRRPDLRPPLGKWCWAVSGPLAATLTAAAVDAHEIDVPA
jgi:hypothetical protein